MAAHTRQRDLVGRFIWPWELFRRNGHATENSSFAFYSLVELRR